MFFVTTKRFIMRKRFWDEAGIITLHWILILNFFSGHGYQLCKLYAVAGAIQGIYLGFFFGLSHFAEDRIEGNKTSWARWQAITAVNWRCECWVSAVASGFLNLQIEHHFFPQCPPFAYPLIAKECKGFCEKHNIPYRELTFVDAADKMMRGKCACYAPSPLCPLKFAARWPGAAKTSSSRSSTNVTTTNTQWSHVCVRGRLVVCLVCCTCLLLR